MSDLFHVSSSPHVRAKDSTDRIMLYVIIALLPASLFGIYNFGFRALFIILLTIASCVASEWVFDYIVKKKSTITDLSAVVTGLLLALNLPVALPWWEAVLVGVFPISISLTLTLESPSFLMSASGVAPEYTSTPFLVTLKLVISAY